MQLGGLGVLRAVEREQAAQGGRIAQMLLQLVGDPFATIVDRRVFVSSKLA
jgi:hypothetical protein